MIYLVVYFGVFGLVSFFKLSVETPQFVEYSGVIGVLFQFVYQASTYAGGKGTWSSSIGLSSSSPANITSLSAYTSASPSHRTTLLRNGWSFLRSLLHPEVLTRALVRMPSLVFRHYLLLNTACAFFCWRSGTAF